MKALLAGAISLVFLMVAGAQEDAAVKKDKAQLKGLWKFESFETADGKSDAFDGALLVFESEHMEMKKNEDSKKAKYTINPLGQPKEIDVKIDDKDMQGIYKIEKETLTICICPESNQARPNEF